ncbi:phytanoyl-CoA dioxygenase family protein [Glaciecola sp. MH2013]|uniref:phytanoyl-CoA dioxygenase family protein n=1 Tax=Glaciecola sp. MH2013 TaxID=2785524 RepID=UPI0018A0B275|nr:phytanoyl-CoA dioxygenase family protein [Glaciecola sp. MH2013]MBF7074001.1 phytanoyl-CoA dioxygenase family protein [Glaciecola sp. MH2013]
MHAISDSYNANGYVVLKKFFSAHELKALHECVSTFHELWLIDNADFYQQRAINSAYLSSTKYLNTAQRSELFAFVSSHKIMRLAHQVLQGNFAFLNTQLFFDPANSTQKNYWHRDAQYHLTLEQQKAMLTQPDVVHFRVPLVDEPGLELVPGSHKRWDSKEELDVRLERNGKTHPEPLSSGHVQALDAGDLMIFSANLIHRGLYSKTNNRLAFDFLFCPNDIKYAEFIDSDCLPTHEQLDNLEAPQVFKNAIDLKARM